VNASRAIIFSGAGLVGAATAATSAVSLYQLAEVCGIPWVLPAALPIAMDVGAAVGAIAWITQSGAIRAWGRGIAIAALIGTLAGNAVQHAIASGLLAVDLGLVLSVGASFPATLWAVFHLTALMTQRDRKKKADATPKQRAPRTVTPNPSREPATNEDAAETTSELKTPDDLGSRRASSEERLTWFLKWSSNNPGASEAEENAAFRAEFINPKTGEPISDPSIRRTKAQARERAS
jgi:hypothetical protein